MAGRVQPWARPYSAPPPPHSYSVSLGSPFSVFLGPLGLCDVFLTFLLFLLLLVSHFDHLGQFPRQQRAGDEERGKGEDDRGEEAVGVLGGPLHHVLRPGAHVNHGRGQTVLSDCRSRTRKVWIVIEEKYTLGEIVRSWIGEGPLVGGHVTCYVKKDAKNARCSNLKITRKTLINCRKYIVQFQI